MTATERPPSPTPSTSSEPDGPFEGPEKLLELWFSPTLDTLPPLPPPTSSHPRRRPPPAQGGEWLGLRAVPREVWEDMLDIVKCKVLSFVEGEEIDAYLLSESSFFVTPNKLIMKTCGTTLNLLGLPRILSIASTYCGLTSVYRCFYSRKSFMFPERQMGPHKGGWGAEVGFLDDIFDNGSAYTVGPMNGDHWLLYVTSPRDASPSPSTTGSPSKTSRQIESPHPTKEDPNTLASSYASTSSVLADALASAALHFPSSSSNDPSSGTTVDVSDPATVSDAATSVHSSNGSNSSSSHHRTPQNHTKPRQESVGAGAVERPLGLPSLGCLSKIGGGEGSDQTLEMLMTHLSEKSRALFYPPPAAEGSGKNGSALGVDMSTACLLSTLFPTSQTTLDSYAFNPCGYSANALVLSPNPTPSTITPPNPSSSSSSSSSSSAAIASSPPSLSEGYWTVHVTPEASHSYASFETNISLPSTSLSSPPHHHHHSSSSTPAYDNPFPDLKTLMRNVVAIFEPGRLTVTLFVSHEEQGHEGEDGWGSGAKVLDDRLVLDGYKRRDRIGYEFEGYDLVFCCFEKIGWVEARD